MARPGTSSRLMSGRMRSRAVFFLRMVPSSSHMNIYPAKGKVVKVVSIWEMRPEGDGQAGAPRRPGTQVRAEDVASISRHLLEEITNAKRNLSNIGAKIGI